MSNATALMILKNIFIDLTPGTSLTIAFQGGEPTMAGLDFYKQFVDAAKGLAKGITISWAFQTNGLVVDNEWCQFFKENRFLVGLSMDLIDHNANRVDKEGKGTRNSVQNTLHLINKHEVEHNILCVLTNQLARYPIRVWKSLVQLNVKHVQFIPCLNSFNETTPMGLTPKRFAGFYNEIIPLWYKAFTAGNYISIKLIDDIVNLLAKNMVTACGLTGQCMPQFIVESDGSVYPCDFYVLDKYRVGSFCEDSIKQLFENDIMQGFTNERKSIGELCKQCRFVNICKSGCKRMKEEMYYRDESNFCGYENVLNENWNIFSSVGKMILM